MAPSARSALLTLAATAFLACLAAPCRAADSDDAEGNAKSAGDAKQGDGDESDEKSGKTKKGDGDAAKKGDEKPANEAFGHAGQFGLRAGIVLGYRMVLRYDSSPYCAAPKPGKPSDQQKFCGYPAPLSVDFGLSFGVLDFFEPFAWARFGLSADGHSDTNPLIMVGAGARLYTMSDAAFKIFVEPAVALELEEGQGTAAWQTINPVYKKDFVFHLAAGPQIDVHPNFGLYATGGLTVGVVRALAASLDLNIGIQGRLP